MVVVVVVVLISTKEFCDELTHKFHYNLLIFVILVSSCLCLIACMYLPSMLQHCWSGLWKSIQPVKIE